MVKRKEEKTKKKMQNLSFGSVDEFLEYLPEDELKIVLLLRRIILDCIPDCTEKLSYNVPFYRRHANICFIWPACVTWGGVSQQGVRMGFTSGYLLQDDLHYLDRGDRKQVYWRDFHHTAEIDVDLLRSYILEAALIDEEKARTKRKQKSKSKMS